jgi:hypothetical protein
MPRFVLLNHDWPTGPRASHYDLMFEVGEVLRTWSLAQLPQAWNGIEGDATIASENAVHADRLPDHRRAYLEYEGPVSGERGTVRRLDRGECRVLIDSDNRFEAEIAGEMLRGTVTLERIGDGWQLTLL